MPRDSGGIWSDIPGINAVPGATIESADWNGYRADLRTNEFNAARPITAGGTGATNAVDALNNLGGVGVSNFLDAYPVGDFYETIRTLDANWLRRNGALYTSADYPALAALLPVLPDGVAWSNFSAGISGFKKIASTSPGFIMAAGNGTDSFIYTSPDGDTFSQVATIAGLVLNTNIVSAGTIFAVGATNGKVSVSNDKVTWTAGTTALTGSPNAVYGLAYGLGLLVAVGQGGKIATSPDGNTWTQRTSGSTQQLNSVSFVNGLFLVVGAAGTILSSPDAINWTTRTSGVAASLEASTFGNGLYVAVGGNGTILTSPNLTAWTARTSGTTQQLFDAIYSTAGFLIVGNGGIARISAANSGTTWNASATGISGLIYSAAFDQTQQNKYIAAVANSTSALKGIRTLPTQFQVPNDSPTYGWIRALPIVP